MEELETKTWIVIAYNQYGNWSITVPFETRAKAERHADLHLRDPKKDYIKLITFLEIELPNIYHPNNRNK